MSSVEGFEHSGNMDDVEFPTVILAGDEDVPEEVVCPTITPSTDGVTRIDGANVIFKGMSFLRMVFNAVIERTYVEQQDLDDEALMDENGGVVGSIGARVVDTVIDDVGDNMRDGMGDMMGNEDGDTMRDDAGDTMGNDDGDTMGDDEDEEDTMGDTILLDPQISQTKGRTRASTILLDKNKRIRSGIEISQQNKKKQVRRCKLCNVQGHYASTCPGKA